MTPRDFVLCLLVEIEIRRPLDGKAVLHERSVHVCHARSSMFRGCVGLVESDGRGGRNDGKHEECSEREGLRLLRQDYYGG